jgi:putative flavoprotein involved in K+ transport
MSRDELVAYLDDYARSFHAPVESNTRVTAVARDGEGYRVATTRGEWWAPNVVIATGHCDLPKIPGIAESIHADVAQIAPSNYRNPEQLAAGGVLVVGASATGIQLAAEIQASGRPVTMAVSRHARLPRSYRGQDIMMWLDEMGVLNQRADQVPNIGTSRRAPSLQLVGSDDHWSIDLGTVQALGVKLVGRAIAAEGAVVHMADDLAENIAMADQRLHQLLAKIDAHIRARGLADIVPAATPIAPVPAPSPPTMLDLTTEGIRTVIWATGFQRSFPWLQVPVLDTHGEILHREGVTPAPGLYLLGQFFQTRRNSSFIDGVGVDARAIARHMERQLARRAVAAA